MDAVEMNVFTIEIFKVTYGDKTGTFTWADIVYFLYKQTELLTNPKPLPYTFTRAVVTLEDKKQRIQAVQDYVSELVTELVRPTIDTYPKLLTETFQGDIFSDHKQFHKVQQLHRLFNTHTIEDYTVHADNSGSETMRTLLQDLSEFTDENVQLDKISLHDNTLLHALCYFGYIPPFKGLLKHLDNKSNSTIDDTKRKSLFETNTDGLNPFMIAVLRDKFEMVCLLLNTLTFGSTQMYYDELFGKDLNPDRDPLFDELCGALDSNVNTLGAKPSGPFCESNLFEMSEESTKRILINANLPAESPVVIAELIKRYLESAPTKLFNTDSQLIEYDCKFPEYLRYAEQNVYFKTLLRIWGKLGCWNEHFKNDPSKIAETFLPVLYESVDVRFRKLSARLSKLSRLSSGLNNKMKEKLITHINWAIQREEKEMIRTDPATLSQKLAQAREQIELLQSKEGDNSESSSQDTTSILSMARKLSAKAKNAICDSADKMPPNITSRQQEIRNRRRNTGYDWGEIDARKASIGNSTNSVKKKKGTKQFSDIA